VNDSGLESRYSIDGIIKPLLNSCYMLCDMRVHACDLTLIDAARMLTANIADLK
jgi:hypothetical protein